MNKNYIIYIIAIGFFLSGIANVLAITAAIQNVPVTLRIGVDETVEKYIRVINRNNVSLSIELEAVGSLAENVELREEKFVLQPHEEKKAYYTIYADEPGTTETRINIKFIPEEGNAVALPGRITVIASGENDLVNAQDEGNNFDELSGENPEDEFNFNPSARDTSDVKEEWSIKKILLASTIVLIALFILLIAYSSKLRKKGSGRTHV